MTVFLEDVNGGSYLEYKNENYLKLTGVNRRVMDYDLSDASTWEDNENWASKAELEGDDWTDPIRESTGEYWTRTEIDVDNAHKVTATGGFASEAKTSSLSTRLCQTLPEGVYVRSGTGSIEDPYVLGVRTSVAISPFTPIVKRESLANSNGITADSYTELDEFKIEGNTLLTIPVTNIATGFPLRITKGGKVRCVRTVNEGSAYETEVKVFTSGVVRIADDLTVEEP